MKHPHQQRHQQKKQTEPSRIAAFGEILATMTQGILFI
jgi:hypothetical protein